MMLYSWATLTQVMSGQIDWSPPSFGLDQLDQKQIRIIATRNDADVFWGQSGPPPQQRRRLRTS
jgi:hypothetical protein